MAIQKTVVVKGKEYNIQVFKGEQAFAIKYELARIAIPFISELQDLQGVDSDEERKKRVILAIEKILSTVDYQTALKLLKTLVSQVYDAQGRLIVPNEEFAQNTKSWYLLAYEVIMFNYEDVFTDLGFGTAE